MCVLIYGVSSCGDTHHILTSPFYNEDTHTHIHTTIEESVTYMCYEPQAIAQSTSYVSPLHLIEDKGTYTIVN